MHRKFYRRTLSAAMSALILFSCFSGCSPQKEEDPTLPATTAGTTAEATTQTLTTAAATAPAVDMTGKNPLTGLAAPTLTEVYRRPLAVMISNAGKARPQWGLSKPDIVFEGLIEAGETRMMGLFSDWESLPQIGPLRSTRHDFVELAQGFDAALIHCGGSYLAYEYIKANNLKTLDGTKYDGKYFLRDQQRRTERGLEHSMYTTSELALKGIKALGMAEEIQASYQYPLAFAPENTPQSLSGGVCNQMEMSFSSISNAKFVYQPASKKYVKSWKGKVMTDGTTGDEITYTNVILLYTTVNTIDDDDKHMEMELTSGEGIYISNGTYTNIRWEKGAGTQPLKLLDEQNAGKLTLNAGNTYIGIVPKERKEKTVIA